MRNERMLRSSSELTMTGPDGTPIGCVVQPTTPRLTGVGAETILLLRPMPTTNGR